MKEAERTITTPRDDPEAYRAPSGTNAAQMTGNAAPLVLPPGVSEDQFSGFIVELGQHLSLENVRVITSREELALEHYSDPSKAHDMFYIYEKDTFVASAVVAPRNVPNVQSIMRLANRFRIPVWPFSIGRNVG